MTAHKHAEVIKQWAEGAEIECRIPPSNLWHPAPWPEWVKNFEYRVKPAREYPQTTLTGDELYAIARHGDLKTVYALKNVANAALQAAIDAGQVVTREEFDRAIGDRKARDLKIVQAVIDHFEPTLKLFKLDVAQAWQFQSIIAEVK